MIILQQDAQTALERLREMRPVVHSITNYVTAGAVMPNMGTAEPRKSARPLGAGNFCILR